MHLFESLGDKTLTFGPRNNDPVDEPDTTTTTDVPTTTTNTVTVPAEMFFAGDEAEFETFIVQLGVIPTTSTEEPTTKAGDCIRDYILSSHL